MLINGAELHVEIDGTGDAIVFLHAGIADASMWDEQAQVFARRHRVIRYDHRGMGRSSMPRAPYALYEDLRGVMDATKIDVASLVGCSMGGTTAIDFAIAFPRRVKKLVLVCAGLGGFPYSHEEEKEWARIEALPLDEQNEELMKMWVDGPRRTPGQVSREVRDRVAELNARNLARSAGEQQIEARWLEPPANDRLREISAPTLVVVGESDQDRIKQIADRLEEEIPDARKVVLPGGHLPNLEHPDEFNRVVLDFLR